MADIEMIIKGLNDVGGFVAGRIGFEQARNFIRTIDDACAMLKKQQEQIDRLLEESASNAEMAEGMKELLKEHRHVETFTVIDTKTGKEADEYNIALYEEWAKHLCYCDMDGWAIMDDGTLLLVDECGRFAYADRERFKVVWDA